MARATPTLQPRVVLVFDFDDTLARDTLDVVLEHLGVEPARFRDERVQPRVDAGWDPLPAAFWSLIEVGREVGRPITRERLQGVGRAMDLFPGVAEMLDRLRGVAREAAGELEVEFYVVSCGLSEVIESNRAIGCFDAVYGSRLHYDRRGEAVFVERIVSHEEKTRYLYGISQSRPRHLEEGEPFRRNPDASTDDLHVPFHQMIYVGDGLTDLPAFALLRAEGGQALGVLKEREANAWARHYEPARGQRVENLAHADYQAESELMRSLELAVRSVAHAVALRKLGEGE